MNDNERLSRTEQGLMAGLLAAGCIRHVLELVILIAIAYWIFTRC